VKLEAIKPAKVTVINVFRFMVSLLCTLVLFLFSLSRCRQSRRPVENVGYIALGEVPRLLRSAHPTAAARVIEAGRRPLLPSTYERTALADCPGNHVAGRHQQPAGGSG
jgi:hypothetical protein